ncbi:decapping endonuclease targeting mRNA [Entomophthora muscae]|uniref:Decapping endonuclease targeting mRNA n=2 Tax=Entomophthora muscae TaxID=34485 RepID=A0ACC2RTN1_9FUNG|nr:decapping endonuclease targeting mRNA [Entomophthora muscae]
MSVNQRDRGNYHDSSSAKRRRDLPTAQEGIRTDTSGVHFGKLRFSPSSSRPPVYSRPKELGTFGYGSDREFVMGSQELKYYYPADLNHPSLSEGFDTFIERDSTKVENLNGLLNYFIQADHPQFERLDNPPIVLYRGVLTKIFCLLYNRRDGFSLSATRFNKVLFLNETKTEAKKAQETNQSERQKLMCYWGYKFESLSTLSKPCPSDKQELEELIQERLRSPVNNHNEHCSVFKSSLDNFRLLMGAEVDCIEGNPNGHAGFPDYVELKTSRIMKDSHQRNMFEKHKLLKFWTQSFLAGIPKVIVGFRDDDGKLCSIETFKTLEIPRLVRSKGHWDPNVCLGFAKQVLGFIVQHAKVDDPYLTYTITYDPENQDLRINKEVSPSPHAFLTEAFIKSANMKYEKLKEKLPNRPV